MDQSAMLLQDEPVTEPHTFVIMSFDSIRLEPAKVLERLADPKIVSSWSCREKLKQCKNKYILPATRIPD